LLKIVINCGLCEELIGPCLASVRGQTHTDWQAIVTVDRRGDATYERALEAKGDDERIVVTRNRRRLYPMENVVRAIRRSHADPDDVIVILDGDDRLLDDRALELIAAAHADEDCWVTYGSWISDDPRRRGPLPPYQPGADFRKEPWLGTAIRTWKRWLFEQIDEADLRDRNGRYFRVAEDLACMLPMLEMATTRRARHIAEPLMFYNRFSHHDPKRRLKNEGLRNAADLRARRPYAPLAAKVVRERPIVESGVAAESFV
jgi:glycosyltransferase involved in cell wall biosynthesis